MHHYSNREERAWRALYERNQPQGWLCSPVITARRPTIFFKKRNQDRDWLRFDEFENELVPT
jgi:hypothetical protein